MPKSGDQNQTLKTIFREVIIVNLTKHPLLNFLSFYSVNNCLSAFGWNFSCIFASEHCIVCLKPVLNSSYLTLQESGSGVFQYLWIKFYADIYCLDLWQCLYRNMYRYWLYTGVLVFIHIFCLWYFKGFLLSFRPCQLQSFQWRSLTVFSSFSYPVLAVITVLSM